MNTVEPIRDLTQIEALKEILKSNSIRDYLLFVMGINTGLRISDLLALKQGDIMDDGGKVLDFIRIREKKTRKQKVFKLNKSARKAVEEYIKRYGFVSERYLFISRKGDNKPISRVQAWEVLNNAAHTVGIRESIGTHTLRKSFGYHAYRQGTDITLLMKIFNHSTPSITLRYIGITQDDINNVYANLNL
jgi:site-specific recombinase XerD